MSYNPNCITALKSAPLSSPFPQADWVDVRWFGTIGNGVADDTLALQAAIDATPTGGELRIPSGSYNISAVLTVTKDITIVGQESTVLTQITNDLGALTVSASNISITGLELVGPRFDTYHGNEIALAISGTYNAGLAPTYITNINITGCKISNWGSTGIQISYATNVTVQNNIINDVIYNGIGLISVQDFNISGNHISNLPATGSSGGNAYGVFASRDTFDVTELVAQPRSQDGVIANNTVDGVPTWSAYDTHGGLNITYSNNVATNVYFGITATSSYNYTDTVATYAPLNIVMSGNVLDSGVTSATAGFGIVLSGNDIQSAGGSITGNFLNNFGTASENFGALTISSSNGVAITGNTIRYPSYDGIYIGPNNTALTISGNTILDPWTNSSGVGGVNGIHFGAGGNSFNVSGNTILHVDKTASYLLTTAVTGVAIRFTSDAGNTGEVTNNYTNAAVPIIDPLNLFSPFFSSSIPIASEITLTSGTSANITSLTLPPGNWLVYGNVIFDINSTTTITFLEGWISSTSATEPSLPNGGAQFIDNTTRSAGVTQLGFSTISRRYNLTSPTTVYLSTRALFGVSTLKAYGFLGAEKVN